MCGRAGGLAGTETGTGTPTLTELAGRHRSCRASAGGPVHKDAHGYAGRRAAPSGGELGGPGALWRPNIRADVRLRWVWRSLAN